MKGSNKVGSFAVQLPVNLALFSPQCQFPHLATLSTSAQYSALVDAKPRCGPPNFENRNALTRHGSRSRQFIIATGLGKHCPPQSANPARNSKSSSKMP